MSDRELLFSVTKKDLDITAIRGSGPGGQHRNKVSTGIRIVHRASGAVAEASDDKSSLINKSAAFKKLLETPKFKIWMKIALAAAQGRESIADAVERQMQPENITTEVLDENNRWVRVEAGDLT